MTRESRYPGSLESWDNSRESGSLGGQCWNVSRESGGFAFKAEIIDESLGVLKLKMDYRNQGGRGVTKHTPKKDLWES